MSKRRRKAADLEHWLADSATPLFVLDAARRLSAFNAGCEALTGWAAGDVVGVTGHYGSGEELSGAAALAASLCPPPEVFSGAEVAAPAVLVSKGGESLRRLLHFYPLRDDGEDVHGVLGIILPVDQPRPPPRISPARDLHAELAAARQAIRTRFGANSLVAQESTMRKVLIQVALAQQSSTAVLLEGEPGTGKEHLARVIHFGGPRRDDWFIPLDCRRLSADELERVWLRLIETHRPALRGSSPQPGTVYLADVEFLPRELQERLVREFVPDDPTQALPLRLLASTARDSRQLGADAAIRDDFLALISPLTICVPPLRERGRDLALLAQYFLEECNRTDPKQIAGFDEAVWPLFLRYHWPANVEELLTVVREAHTQALGPLIRPDDLPFRFRSAFEAQQLPPGASTQSLPLDALLTRVETRLIRLALERSKGNKSKAAEILGIHRGRLIRRIEQLRLATDQTSGDLTDSPDEAPEKLPEDIPSVE